MKRNVDLSDSRMFTTPEEPTGIFKTLWDLIKITKPWDFEHNPRKIYSDDDLIKPHSLIALGNKKERQIWKHHQACYADEICDRCGQSTGKKPWAKNRCNCYRMGKNGLPWKF